VHSKFLRMLFPSSCACYKLSAKAILGHSRLQLFELPSNRPRSQLVSRKPSQLLIHLRDGSKLPRSLLLLLRLRRDTGILFSTLGSKFWYHWSLLQFRVSSVNVGDKSPDSPPLANFPSSVARKHKMSPCSLSFPDRQYLASCIEAIVFTVILVVK
jgi:hypothetical protein